MVVHMASLDTEIALELSEFDISFDKMESKYQRKLSEKTLAEIDEILRIVDSDPKTAIDRIINLLEENPNNPILNNHLSAAYSRAGQHDKAELVAIDNYEKYPDYLFAKTNYAQICIWHGKSTRSRPSLNTISICVHSIQNEKHFISLNLCLSWKL